MRCFASFLICLVCCSASVAADESTKLPAFPGAEGAGAFSLGGRGGKVYAVTTLEDHLPTKKNPVTPGSFRWAVTQPGPRIVVRHILPNILNPIIVQVTLSTAFAILAEAALSFLGLGAQPPTPSWGQDINYSQRYLANQMWWMSAGPGIAIFLAVFAFNFLGDALRDVLDPQLRNRG